MSKPMEGASVWDRPRYAEAMYTDRTVVRWYLRLLRFRLKHGATLRGAWREAQYIRRTQKAMPRG